MAQTLELNIVGLDLNNNQFGAVRLGSLAVANNIVIDRDSVAETRRGQATFGEPVASGHGGDIEKLFFFRDTQLVLVSGTMFRDTNETGNWAAYTGEFLTPSSGIKIKDVEENRNLYITTSSGIQKLDQVAGEFRNSGSPKALGGTATLSGTGGFLNSERSVAYRLVWGYVDANTNEIIGSPSQRLIVFNTDASNGTDVLVNFDIPEGITTQYFAQLYRSLETLSSTGEPEDELQLSRQINPTAADITAGFITIFDDTPTVLLGADLYTNPSQEGILQSNDPPPLAKDITSYKSLTMFANTATSHRYFNNLIGVGQDTVAFGYVTVTGGSDSGSATITGVNDVTFVRDGMRAVGSGIPTNTRVVSVGPGSAIVLTDEATATRLELTLQLQDVLSIGDEEYFASSGTNFQTNEFLAFATGTPGENIETTSLELIRIVNRNGSSGQYAYHISGFNEVPGKFLFENKTLGDPSFTLTSTAGDSWSPELSTVSGIENSINEERENRVFISKAGQPEAVPSTNFLDVGSANASIERIFGLRQSVYVLKEDGVFQIIGEGVNSLSVNAFDTTSKIRGPETAVIFNNQILYFSAQGVATLGDAATVSLISRPIETALRALSSDLFPNFKEIAFGVAYDSDYKYILFTPTSTSDTHATQAWVYHALTQSWTNWPLPRSYARVNPRDDKLYLTNPENGFVYQERKNFTRSDYADEEYPVDITTVSGNILTLSSLDNVSDDYTIVQGLKESPIETVTTGTSQIEVTEDLLWDTGSAVVFNTKMSEIQWVTNKAQNPGIVKNFIESTYLFRNADFDDIQVGFSSDLNPLLTFTTLTPVDLGGGWGEFPWGEVPWGAPVRGTQTIRTYVPLAYARCHWLNIALSLSQAFTSFSLEGFSTEVEGVSSRFK